MNKYYYKKRSKKNIKPLFRLLSLLLFSVGIFSMLYVFFPLISWQVYFAPVFASQNITAPIPKTTIVNSSTIESLILQASNSLSGVDYTNAQNWFPGLSLHPNSQGTIQEYKLSIPKLGISDAVVSTIDNDLSKHLVNYPGTAIPTDNGNSVIFGHSTLPQLFNPKDYKAIFATLHTLRVKDTFSVSVHNVTYTY